MNIQVGQWYEVVDICSSDGARLRGHVVAGILNTRRLAVVLYCDGSFDSLLTFEDNGSSYCGNYVCREHLPGCTGPSWKPMKWRPAIVDDLKKNTAKARFRDHDTQEWWCSCLCGARRVSSSFHWQDTALNHWWTQCEVLDEPS